MTNRININPLLDEIIKESGRTQEEIAKDMGYDRAYLSQARKEGTRKLMDKLTAYRENVRKSKEVNTSKEGHYRDKYIESLERMVEKQEALLVEVRASLKDVAGRLTEAEKMLAEVRGNQRIMYSVQQAFQKYWIDYLEQTDSSQVGAQKKIASIAAVNLKKIQKEGIVL